jgi:hypothetical protein
MIHILDNFYKDPKIIESLIKEFNVTGCGSGVKTLDLSYLDKSLYNSLKTDLCRLHQFDPNRIAFYSYFSEHNYNHEDDIFNYSAIHIDGKGGCNIDDYNLVFCGQVLLTENPDPDSGVLIYKFKNDNPEIMNDALNNYTIPGEQYRQGSISLDKFKKMKAEYNSNFELTCEVKNVYNRMVSWVGGTPHAQRVTKNVPRKINQYFFAEIL